MRVSDERRATSDRNGVIRSDVLLVACDLLLVAVLTGCESFQRKFVRKSRQPATRPSPIVNFQDYSRAMTPLERYQKHYMIFSYWNDQLIEALHDTSPNPKRFKQASKESLAELETLKGLVSDDVAARLATLIERRARIDRQLQSAAFTPSDVSLIWRTLEAQTRQIDREFFWRHVQDQLKPQ